MFPVDIAKFLRIVLLKNTSGGCFWQSYNGTVKSAGVPVLWFRASTCFWFWSKTFTKRCSNNSLLSRDKTISSLLDLIGHVLLIFRICFGKTIVFDFDEKLIQSVAQELCNITCQKTFFPFTLRVVRCFRFQGMIWKTEHGGENPDFGFVPPLFTLLTLKRIYFASCFCCSCKLF